MECPWYFRQGRCSWKGLWPNNAGHVFLSKQLIKLQQQLKDLRRENRKEHEELLADFSQQLNKMEEELSKKNEEVSELLELQLHMYMSF